MMDPARCARVGLWFCAAVALLVSGNAQPDTLANAQFISVPRVELPEYLVPTVDASLGITSVRVTAPGVSMGNGVACEPSYCTHRYSSAQAWNADQSLLLIANGCNGLCFLDGHTYAPLFVRQRRDECEWHPRDPQVMICVSGRRIFQWAPRSNSEEVIVELEAYRELRFGPNKGNLSSDGNRIVVRARNQNGALVAFAVDLSTRQKFPDIDLGRIPGNNSYCGISPLGGYIFCQQSFFDGTDQAFVFGINGILNQSWTEHHRPGHGDMTVDDDGQEVYVGISKSPPDKYQVIKRRLQDGLVTPLAPPGEAQHASTRATGRPGWVFLSYAGNPLEVADQLPPPLVQEVIALKIDGSGEFRPVAHTFNTPYDYWSETHASPSPDGSQVIWSTNWGQRGGPVSDFVSHLDWPDQDSRSELIQGDHHERQ